MTPKPENTKEPASEVGCHAPTCSPSFCHGCTTPVACRSYNECLNDFDDRLSVGPETIAYRDSLNEDFDVELALMTEFACKMEESRNYARATAKYWQEQYSHANPDHEWEDFIWENA